MGNKRAGLLAHLFVPLSILIFISGCGQQAQSSEGTSSQLPPAPTTSGAPTTAVTSSQSPYGGKLVLDDPLRDNSRGYKWDETNYSGDVCQFKNGAYHATVLERNDEFCIAEAPTFANFAFQVNMVILTGDGGGIMFRLHTQIDSNGNATQLTGYEFLIYPNSSYLFISYNYSGTGNPKLTTLSSGTSPAINQGLNQSNLIAEVASGETFDLYVNRQHIASVSDSSFSSGHIAVVAEDLSNPADVAFNDAKVWQL